MYQPLSLSIWPINQSDAYTWDVLEQRKISEILVYSTDYDNEEYAAVRHLKTGSMVERAKVRKDDWHHKTARESRQVREPSQHSFLPLKFSHQECENFVAVDRLAMGGRDRI